MAVSLNLITFQANTSVADKKCVLKKCVLVGKSLTGHKGGMGGSTGIAAKAAEGVRLSSLIMEIN